MPRYPQTATSKCQHTTASTSTTTHRLVRHGVGCNLKSACIRANFSFRIPHSTAAGVVVCTLAMDAAGRTRALFYAISITMLIRYSDILGLIVDILGLIFAAGYFVVCKYTVLTSGVLTHRLHSCVWYNSGLCSLPPCASCLQDSMYTVSAHTQSALH